MNALLCFFLTLFASRFKSKSRLEPENAALRHQLIVGQKSSQRCRAPMTQADSEVPVLPENRWYNVRSKSWRSP
jgi:hypothetical protein